MQEITEMGKKGINKMEWVVREEWRRKIKLDTEKCEDINTLYINKIISLLYIHVIDMGWILT